MMKIRLIAAIIIAVAGLNALSAANWPSWRGPDGNGISPETDLPLRWGPDQNVRWRRPLPEPGNSTPIVWEQQVFVTQPLTPGNRRALLCFNRHDGDLLWQATVTVETMERTHRTNPYASASPVTDGRRVICWFGSAGVVAYDFQGQELWKTDLGRHDHRFGYGGSPVLHGDLVVLNFGPGTREFLVALDKHTGQEVWRHKSSIPGKDDIYGTWSTPFVTEWKGEPRLLSALRGELAALNPATGDIIWKTDAFGIQAKSSPFAGEGVAVMSGDMESREVAVRMGGKGDVTDTHILWRRDPPKRRIGTGIIRDGVIFGVQTGGMADCVDLNTGEIIWEERLSGDVWSSPVLAGERLYVMNQSGDVFVYEAARKFRSLATNSIGESANASVVPSGGELFLRTHEALWCIQ